MPVVSYKLFVLGTNPRKVIDCCKVGVPIGVGDSVDDVTVVGTWIEDHDIVNSYNCTMLSTPML